MGSVVVACGLWNAGSVVVAYGHVGMWVYGHIALRPVDSSPEPCPLHWQEAS